MGFHTMMNKKMPSIKDQEVLMMKLAHSWLVEHDPQCIPHFGKSLPSILQNLVEVILEMLSQLCVSQKPHDLLLPLFFYANKYITKAGVQHNQLSNVLITSMVVTLKLWDDEAGVWNNDVATAYGRNLGDMNDMERLFLQYLEYNLYLTPEQVFLFAVDCKFARLQSRDNAGKKDLPLVASGEGRKRKLDICAPLGESWVLNNPKQQKC